MIARRQEGPFYGYQIQFYSAGRSYCLVFWAFVSIPAMSYHCRAYADLPTALTIVHLDGTHPIPPQYKNLKLEKKRKKEERALYSKTNIQVSAGQRRPVGPTRKPLAGLRTVRS